MEKNGTATETVGTAPEEFRTWGVVELLGHVRMVGIISEEERFGIKMGRIDMLQADGSCVTRYFGGASVYRITPMSEEAARKMLAPARRPLLLYEEPNDADDDDACAEG